MVEQYLVILFVKLAVAASLSSILARFGIFQRMLMLEERTLWQRLRLALGFAILFGAGVATRLLSRNNYQAVDLGLEGCLLAGLLGGYVPGLTSGILISLPAMSHGELLTMPLFAGIGVFGGLLRDLAPEKEDIWRFSPFFDLGVIRRLRNPRPILFHLTLALTILFAEFLRINLAQSFGSRYLFSLSPPEGSRLLMWALYFTTLFAVTLPLKIWNNTRNERKLEAQQALLQNARLRVLANQINPHFLFNTLNSVQSLIRINPEQARTMVYKLSAILRRLLRKPESLTPLRDELAFIDDYLSIELVRFGDKLRFEKEVAADTLDLFVPNMLLQPLVENSIKHGLSNKVTGGCIRIESAAHGSRLLLTVADDGVGIAPERLANLFERGIGFSNVNERLQVLYGNEFRLSVISQPDQGTRVEIEIPRAAVRLAAVS